MINEKGNRDGSPGLTDATRLEIEAVEMEIGDGATLIGVSRKRNAGRPFDSIFFRRSAKVYEPGAKLEQSDAENGVGARLIIRFLNVAALDSVMATLAEIRAHLEASAAKARGATRRGTRPFLFHRMRRLRAGSEGGDAGMGATGG